MTALPSIMKLRARGRSRALALALVASALLAAGNSARAADPVKADVKVFNDSGYARLVFHLDEPVDAKVSMSGAIMVITFKKPMDVAVDRLNAGAPDYITAARRDPDGTAIRLALAQKIRVNTIPAGEWLYVDLLPKSWTGVMPGLPQEVIDDLARRARDAERKLNQQRLSIRQQTPPTIRVKVAKQPTFMRYVFEMPNHANAVTERSDSALTLTFDQPIKWDLGEANAALPPTLQSIESVLDFDSTTISFTLNGAPEVRNFHEDRAIVVDIGMTGAKPKPVAQQGDPKHAAEKKDDKPAMAEAQAAKASPKIDAPQSMPAQENTPAAPAMAAAPASPLPKAMPPPAPAAKAFPMPSGPTPATLLGVMRAVEAPAPAIPIVAPLAAPVAPATAPLPKAEVAKQDNTVPPAVEAKAAPPGKAAEVKAPAPNPNAPVVVAAHRSGDVLRLEFPFAMPTPAAAFRRADTLWLVFDSAAKIDIGALTANETSQLIRTSVLDRGADGEAILRLRLERPQMTSLAADGPSWVLTIGDGGAAPTKPLVVARGLTDKNHASISIPFEQAQKIHSVTDPEVGDRLLVITALGPSRGFIKGFDFVELRALASTQGVVVQPLADDIRAELAPDRITITRPGGLTLSSGAISERAVNTFTYNPVLFDTQIWGFDHEAKYIERQNDLVRLAATAPESKRYQARLNLARFYLSRDMGAEAKGVLDVAAVRPAR